MPEILTSADAQYALDLVKAVCEQVGSGLPGTAQERGRAEVFRKELQTHLGSENVAVENFTFAPDGFLSPLPGIFLVLAVLLNISMGRIPGVSPWITSIFALIFSILAPLVFILQFLLGLEVLDPLLPKRTSQNVIGTLCKPGTEKVKRLLILGGHHDSAPENTWLRGLHALHRWIMQRGPQDAAREDRWYRTLGIGFYCFSGIFFIGFATVLVLNAIQLAGVLAGDAAAVRSGTLGWALLIFPILPAVIYGLFTLRGTKNGGNVPGAADNLSASALTVAMCRFLVENPAYIPEDTEIRFISFGCEEAGLRGSRRYVTRHLGELEKLDARLLNFETVAHPEIIILTSDANGTVQNSAEMVKSVIAAARRAGVPFKAQAASLGEGSDAAPFSRAGLLAATLLPFQVPQQLIGFYHQKWDTPEVLTIEPLMNVLKLTLEWIRGGVE